MDLLFTFLTTGVPNFLCLICVVGAFLVFCCPHAHDVIIAALQHVKGWGNLLSCIRGKKLMSKSGVYRIIISEYLFWVSEIRAKLISENTYRKYIYIHAMM